MLYSAATSGGSGGEALLLVLLLDELVSDDEDGRDASAEVDDPRVAPEDDCSLSSAADKCDDRGTRDPCCGRIGVRKFGNSPIASATALCSSLIQKPCWVSPPSRGSGSRLSSRLLFASRAFDRLPRIFDPFFPVVETTTLLHLSGVSLQKSLWETEQRKLVSRLM